MMKDVPSPNGRWELSKRESTYHFDKFQEESPFQVLGHFVGEDWAPELNNLMKISNGGTPFNFFLKHNFKWEAEQIDMERAGYRSTNVFINQIKKPHFSRQNAPTIFKMIDWTELAAPLSARLHIQHPGQVFPFHVDLLNFRQASSGLAAEMQKEPKEWVRFQIQLAEWDWGHVWAVGNAYWKQWKAGEVMYHTWYDIPHGTANCGLTARCTLQVSGRITEGTRRKIQLDRAPIDLSTIQPGTFNETEF